MSSNHFQNNRVVHRNATSAVQIGIDTQSSIKTTNDKLDLALTQQTAVNTKLDSFSGAINNASIGDGSVKLQTYVYGHDASAGQARALKVDATGRLECNVADIELHTGDISLSVDGLEGLIGTTNTKLQSDLDFAGQPNAIGDGSNMKRVMNYGHDSAGGQQRPLLVDSSGMLKVVVASGAGSATEAKQDAGIVHLATIAGDTTSLDSKVTACNTGAVVISSSALPSGAATAALQGTANTALGEIEGAVENLELTVGTNTATAPTRALQIGGKYQDGTFRDIKVDNIGKVIVDTPTGSDLDTRLATIGTNTLGLAGCVAGTELQVDVVSMPTTAVTLAGGATEAKQDVIETTLTAIETDAAALEVLQTSTNTKLDTLETSNQLINTTCSSRLATVNTSVGSLTTANHTDLVALEASLTSMEGKQDTIITHLSEIEGAAETIETAYGLNKCNVNISSDAVGLATQTTLAAAEAHLGNIDTGVDVLEACVGSNKVNVNIASNAVDFATQTTLAAAEAHLGNIDTGVDVLEACVGSNKVNVNIASNAVDFATQTTLAAAEAHLGNIDTGVDVLEACVGSNKVNVNIASNAVDFATQTTLAAAEAHLGNIDTATAASATDLAAIEVLITATNSKIDTLDAQVDLLEGTNTIKDVEWLSGATISDQSLSDVLDTEGYERVFIYGENSAPVSANNFKIFGSNASAGTYYSVGQMAVVNSDTGRYLLREDSPLHDGPSPRYLKVFNNTGSSQTITKLRAVMSHKLRYV